MGRTYLFVYGTLKSDFGHEMHKHLEMGGQLLGQASCRGKLYLIDWYPALIPSSDRSDQVHGEVYELLQPELTLAILDQYEAISDPPNEKDEYRRQKHEVSLENGTKLQAWVYWYQQSVQEDRRIHSGIFLPSTSF